MKKPSKRRLIAATGIAAACAGLVGTGLAVTGGGSATAGTTVDNSAVTTSPIKHVVVLFGENISFDHYFGTYPTATNQDGVPFTGKAPTTSDGKPVNNLVSAGLMSPKNPNSVQPFRLSNDQALTTSQNHNYIPEQQAEDADATTGAAKMDKFPEYTNSSTNCASAAVNTYCNAGSNMGYFDGNTATALWNYAQNYAMSENAWADDFGPSTDGALNLVAGQTYGAINFDGGTAGESPTPLTNTSDSTKPVADSGSIADNHLTNVALPVYPTAANPTPTPGAAVQASVGTVVGDPDPIYDDCSYGSGNDQAGMLGQNIGDVLNSKNVTWGWFQGGFRPATPYAGPGTKAACKSTHTNIGNISEPDYSEHHDPFQYYASTANPHHLPGTPGVQTGSTDLQHEVGTTWYGANHQYDTSVFDQAVNNQNGQTLPAVSFVKAAEYQDGHPGNSDPIDEEHFYTHVINELEKSPYWSSTAVIINYDDSDGWYDHQAPTILTGSNITGSSGFVGTGETAGTANSGDQAVCTVPDANGKPAPTNTGSQDSGHVENGRCGPSQRIPFLVISPYAKTNFVDNSSVIGQASIDKFIEQNWSLAPAGTSAIDNGAVTGSFDTRDGSIMNMFNLTKQSNGTWTGTPTPGTLQLNPNGSILSDTVGAKATPKPPVSTTPATNAKLAAAKAKLAKDKAALKKAQKAAKKAKGAKKAKANKKVAKLKKAVKKDQQAVKAAS